MGTATGVPSTTEVITSVLHARPEVAGFLHEAHDQAWAAIDPVLAELTRLRIAMLLGAHTELAVRTPAAMQAGLDEATVEELSSWPVSPRFGERQRACLGFTEQWVIDVAALTDAQADAVAAHLGADGLAAYASAVLVLEQRQRLRLAWSQLFEGVGR